MTDNARYDLNPYPIEVPPSVSGQSRALYEFLNQLLDTLRVEHNRTQAGDTTFPWQELLRVDKEPRYTLGSQGRFHHESLGILLGRYVLFSEVDESLPTNTPWAVISGRDAFSWRVTNIRRAYNQSLISGVNVHDQLPPKDYYGWLMTEGPNLTDLHLQPGSNLDDGDFLSWYDGGLLISVDTEALAFATVYNRKLIQSDTCKPGSIFLSSDLVNPVGLPNVDVSLPSKVSSLEQRIKSLESGLGYQTLINQIDGLVQRLEGQIDELNFGVDIVSQRITQIDRSGIFAEFQRGLNLVAQYQRAAQDAANSASGSALATQITLSAANRSSESARIYRDQSGYYAQASQDRAVEVSLLSADSRISAEAAEGFSVSASDSAAAAQSYALLAASIGPGYINKNPLFTNFTNPGPGAGIKPDDWGSYNGYTAFIGERVAGDPGGWNFRITTDNPTTNPVGIEQFVIGLIPNGWYVLEWDFVLEAGSVQHGRIDVHTLLSGSTVNLVSYYSNTNLVDQTNTPIETHSVVGQTYRVRILHQVTGSPDTVVIKFFPKDTTGVTGNTTLHKRMAIRAASQAEIQSGQAASDIATVAASVTTESAARVAGDSALASSLSTLSTTVGGHTTTLTTYGASISGLQAKYGVTINSNGHVTGFELLGGGGTSSFIVTVTNFAVVDPSGGSPFTPFQILGGVVYIKSAAIQNLQVDKLISGTASASWTQNGDITVGTGKVIFNNGSVMKIQGLGFGSSNQFLEWYGPTMSLSSCNESNGYMWFKLNGDSYFGGALRAGTLTTSIQNPAVSATAEVETPVFGSNGGTITVTMSFSYTSYRRNSYSPSQGSSFAAEKATISPAPTNTGGGSDYWMSGPNAGSNTVIQLYRSINGGAYSLVGTYNYGSSWRWDGERPNGVDPGWAELRDSIGGSITYTDPTNSTQNRQYKAVITSRPVQTTTGASQRLGLVCVEP